MSLTTYLRRRKEKKARERTVPKLPTPPKAESVEERVSAIYDRFVTRTQADVTGLWEMLGSRRKLLWVNFLAGLSRGVGFFLGVTLIGGLVIGGTALILDKTAETLGWKDVTFAALVENVYGKFREVRNVIETIEDEPAAGVDADDLALDPETSYRFVAPSYFDRAGPPWPTSGEPPSGRPPEADGR